MKNVKIFILIMTMIFVVTSCSLDESVGTAAPSGSDLKLVINEYLASNNACCTDEFGEYDDWFEIYNNDSIAIDIGGMYVSDSKSDYQRVQIPKTNSLLTTIQPGGFVVIWCDNPPNQGPLHVDFRLSSGGEDITLVEEDGRTIIDQLSYGAQTTDVSMGRNPDGTGDWESYTTPTPGASNNR